MECPVCEAQTRVADSRQVEGGVRRRRVCDTCGFRRTTYERFADDELELKSVGKREALRLLRDFLSTPWALEVVHAEEVEPPDELADLTDA